MIISELKESIIRELAKYQYLTTSQMISLGISGNADVLRRNIKELRDSNRAFIGSIKYGTAQRMGKREYFHYLTKKGVKLALDELFLLPEQIKAPKNKKPNITTDYYHRKSSIDFQIRLYQYLQSVEGYPIFFDTYFERTGSNRTTKSRAKTAINTKKSYLLADAVFLVDVPLMDNRKKYLYAFEMHNTNSTKNIAEQLGRYIECLEIGSIATKYGLEMGSRVLSVFEDPNKMQHTIKRLQENPQITNYVSLFLFKPLAEILTNGVFEGWTTANSEVVNLY